VEQPDIVAMLENGFFSSRGGTIVNELTISEQIGVVLRDIDSDDHPLSRRFIGETFGVSITPPELPPMAIIGVDFWNCGNQTRGEQSSGEKRKFRFQEPPSRSNSLQIRVRIRGQDGVF
jgi:hypothetical protein